MAGNWVSFLTRVGDNAILSASSISRSIFPSVGISSMATMTRHPAPSQDGTRQMPTESPSANFDPSDPAASDFDLGSFSHQLSNIFTVILGHVHLAEMDTDPYDPRRDDYKQIRQSVNRGMRLIEQIQTVTPSRPIPEVPPSQAPS